MNLAQTLDGFKLQLQKTIEPTEIAAGEYIYNNGDCQILTQSGKKFEFIFSGEHTVDDIYLVFIENEDTGETAIHTSTKEWGRYAYACLLQLGNELHLLDPKDNEEHKKYTRTGMIKRVMDERQHKALLANYRIKWASNIYGDHILTNENGNKYKIFLRDFVNETGYSDSLDSANNKLGTTKHIMYAYRILKENQSLYKRLSKTCPFIEIYLDPLSDYRVSYFYPHELSIDTKLFLSKYFGANTYIEEEKLFEFADFFTEAQFFSNILIRPEVKDKIEYLFEHRSLQTIHRNYKPNFSSINATLYEYQKEGIAFAACRKHAIIADEMGLGKTIQAIGASILKKELFGFKKTLIVCPASLKAQWKSEIEKFTAEKAILVEGSPDERAELYKKSDALFLIVNYETVLRDQLEMNKANFGFMILDEAQKVKNYATKTAGAVKNIKSKHVLVITGTPIENKLIDLFSIVSILDPHFLGPLWEFSYQYCLFDREKENKINGYYNLQKLKEHLSPILLRREKRKVLEQLPNVQQQDIYVGMTHLQQDYHAGYAAGIAQIICKKFLLPYDMQKLQLLLMSMRMVCNSTYLIDEQTNDSPKLDELKYILLDKLDLRNSDRKVIIFSEWIKMHKLIGQMLRENGIGFAELNGRVPVNKRGELIKRFETNESCKVFLSTEAGGAGLNLQMADILINFELPWNPAKKNQRIGRIDRLGQKSSKLNIFNFITRDSIEVRIASGLIIKQNLFEGVLNQESTTDLVDFSEKGRSQFLKQIEEMVHDFEKQSESEVEIPETVEEMAQLIAEVSETPLVEEELAEDNFDEEIPGPIANVLTEQEEIHTPETSTKPTTSASPTQSAVTQAEQMEQVMNNGMQFLSGLFQMATGKQVGFENQKIDINKETGEVTMKFKLPV